MTKALAPGSSRSRTYAPLLIILAGCMWGTLGLFVRHLGSLGLDTMTIVLTRMLGSAVMMVVFLVAYDPSLLKVRLRHLWCFVGAGIASMALFNYLYTLAVGLTTLSFAAVLLCTAPVFVVLLSAVIFGERVTPVKLVAMLLTYLGCVLVADAFQAGQSVTLWGVVTGIASSLGYALYSIFSRSALLRGYRPMTINAYSFIFASAGCAVFADFGQIASIVSRAPALNASIMLLHALIGVFLPYLLYTFGMQYVDTGRAAILASCEPATATVAGAVAYGEMPTPISLVGMLLVFAALALMSGSFPIGRLRHTA